MHCIIIRLFLETTCSNSICKPQAIAYRVRGGGNNTPRPLRGRKYPPASLTVSMKLVIVVIYIYSREGRVMHLYPMGVLSRSRPWRKPCERAWPCMHSSNGNKEFNPIKTLIFSIYRKLLFIDFGSRVFHINFISVTIFWILNTEKPYLLKANVYIRTNSSILFNFSFTSHARNVFWWTS